MTLTRLAVLALLVLTVGTLRAHRADAQARTAPRIAAPAPSSVQFALAGGLSLPAGDLGANADLGTSLDLRAEGRLRDPRWSLRGDLSWDRYDGHGFVNSYSYVALAGNLVHRERTNHLYEFGGLGVYNSRVEFVSSGTRSDTNLGMQAGLGLDLNTGIPRWFTEFGLSTAFTSGRSSVWFPVRVGFWF